MPLTADAIKKAAKKAGFDLCGIAEVRNFDAEQSFFRHWLARGYAEGLEYLGRNVEKRFSPSLLVEGARSVIVCAVSYKSDVDPTPDCNTKVASYARNRDYHKTIKEMLAAMAVDIKEVCGEFSFRAFTDSAPVAEKRWAVEAGLGWIGRNKLLVTPDFGSFVLLGELIVDAAVDVYDEPYGGNGCGDCVRCIAACPNTAITADGGIDTRRCISRITVEKETESLPENVTLNGWVFGCDECQLACPYNAKAPVASNPAFMTLFDPCDISREEWLAMSEEEFALRFADTPMSRSSQERIKRYVARNI